MSGADGMILIQRMILEAHQRLNFHARTTLMIVMMTNFLTCHGRYNRYTVSCM